jgi:hypothetical protein
MIRTIARPATRLILAAGMLAAGVDASAQPTPAAIGVGADAGGAPQARVLNSGAGPIHDFFAFTPSYSGGVRVALGDIDGDGVTDAIVAPGIGGTNVRVLDGVDLGLLRDFVPFAPTFTGGIYVAAGDVDGDGRVDIVTGAGAGSGGGAVRVFSGRTGFIIRDLEPFGSAHTRGIRVAAGDVNGDGYADLVVGAGAGGTPEVRVFSGNGGATLDTFNAFPAGFTSGIFVATGDVNGDGRADIIAGADSGTSPTVRAFLSPEHVVVANFLAYPPGFTGGVRVAASDRDGNGIDDVMTGPGPGAAPQVNLYSGAGGGAPASFNAFAPTFTGGVFVAAPVGTPSILRDGFEAR